MKKKSLNADQIFLLVMTAVCFLLYFSWSVIIPFNHAPDEYMRYQIPNFIYKYGTLPAGDNELLRNETWGFCYGFFPPASYMISAFFMKIAGLFSTDAAVLLGAARLTSIFSSLGTLYFCTKIGGLLFDRLYAKLFVISVALLPQFVFISSYVNAEAFGIFTVAMTIYAMLYAKSNHWRFRDCIFLGCAVGLCLLSYYNCYGIIPVALLYCVASVLGDDGIEHKLCFILTRFLWVAATAALVSGWWFIRNAMLYNGDFLGLSTLNKCKELYAETPYKPSNSNTPYHAGVSLPYMLFDMRWISLTVLSFIGIFDYFSVYIQESSYRIIKLLFAFGVFGWFLSCGKWRGKKQEHNNLLLHIAMILMCIITILLSLYNSYFNDFQPQGRYILPMLVSLEILLTHGHYQLFDKLLHEKRTYAAISLIVIYVMIVFYAMVDIVIPAYR